MEVETAAPSAKLQKLQQQRQKRRERKKQNKAKKKQQEEQQAQKAEPEKQSEEDTKDDIDFEIEYVAAPIFQNEEEASMFEDIKEIVEHFTLPQGEEEEAPEKVEQQEEVKAEKLSKKKKKLQKRLPIAVLKQLVERPDLVELHDTAAADPLTLLHLKSQRNTVPIPRHWSQKKKYLQGKRGIEKQPFELPDFIKATHIEDIRNSNKEAHKKLATKARERMRPTLGKMDIDYQVLHDAFFKYQTKPPMTIYGDLYYEGKEFEVEMLEKRPGMISERLKEALGMTPGAPPPYLHNMQRAGMPPSYQTLRIPGMNAPRPPGTEFGFHPGGWGQPPLDEYGNALYPEAFSEPVEVEISEFRILEGPHWGSMMKEESAESEQEEEENESSEEEEDQEDIVMTGLDIVPAQPEPQEDLSGIETPSGMETPTNIEATLRKRKNKDLYTVLEQRDANVTSAELYGSSHLYVVPTKEKKDKQKAGGAERVDLLKSQRTEAIELSLDPSEIPDLTEDALAKKFDKEVADRKKKDAIDNGDDASKKRKRATSSAKDQPKKKKKKDEFKF